MKKKFMIHFYQVEPTQKKIFDSILKNVKFDGKFGKNHLKHLKNHRDSFYTLEISKPRESFLPEIGNRKTGETMPLKILDSEDLFEQSSLLYNINTGVIAITKTQQGPNISVFSDILTEFLSNKENPVFITFLPVTNTSTLERMKQMTIAKRLQIRVSRDVIKDSKDPYINSLTTWDSSLDPDYIEILSVSKNGNPFTDFLKNKICAIIPFATVLKVSGSDNNQHSNTKKTAELLDLIKDLMTETIKETIIDRNVSHATRVSILQKAYNNKREIVEKRFS